MNAAHPSKAKSYRFASPVSTDQDKWKAERSPYSLSRARYSTVTLLARLRGLSTSPTHVRRDFERQLKMYERYFGKLVSPIRLYRVNGNEIVNPCLRNSPARLS